MVKKMIKKVKDDQETETRRQLLEELFADFNRSRVQVYKMNFVRGIFFGLGSVIGGTIVVAIIVSILASVGQNVPVLQDAVDNVTNTIQPDNE
jgi:hypothetical protein